MADEVAHIQDGDNTAVKDRVWQKYPELNSDRPKIVLMGDSVLDNFHWLQNPSRPLRRVLEDIFAEEGSDFQVINLAVDQMQTYDFIRRTPETNPWRHYESSRRQETAGLADVNPMDTTYDYCVAQDGNVYSIENVKRLKNVQYIVLSLGGNDVYLRAENQIKLYKSMLPFCTHLREEVAHNMKARMQLLYAELTAAVPSAKIIPVVVYHPHNAFNIAGADGFVGGIVTFFQKHRLRHLVSPIAKACMEMAVEYNVPLIDLSQTFDPDNERHYGVMEIGGDRYWSGAEPSDVSQVFIARLVHHIVTSADAAVGATLFHGVTDGDVYVDTVQIPLTPRYISSYTFSRGGNC